MRPGTVEPDKIVPLSGERSNQTHPQAQSIQSAVPVDVRNVWLTAERITLTGENPKTCIDAQYTWLEVERDWYRKGNRGRLSRAGIFNFEIFSIERCKQYFKE